MHKALDLVYQITEFRSSTAFNRKLVRFLLKKPCFLYRVIYIFIIIVQARELTQLKTVCLPHKLRVAFRRNRNLVNRNAFVI